TNSPKENGPIILIIIVNPAAYPEYPDRPFYDNFNIKAGGKKQKGKRRKTASPYLRGACVVWPL
ncbi:MAG TPA: hypothetical protein VLR91_01770, partial [Thermodesulfobacteriota bacterium]|nr:hypothetical protein [Thermodesulfobacteriota bacterium]